MINKCGLIKTPTHFSHTAYIRIYDAESVVSLSCFRACVCTNQAMLLNSLFIVIVVKYTRHVYNIQILTTHTTQSEWRKGRTPPKLKWAQTHFDYAFKDVSHSKLLSVAWCWLFACSFRTVTVCNLNFVGTLSLIMLTLNCVYKLLAVHKYS